MSVSSRPDNRLLAALPEEEYQRLLPDLELVAMPVGQILQRVGELIDYVYFPTNALASILTIMEDGGTIEVGLAGREGIVGVSVFLGDSLARNQVVIQIAGDCLRMPAYRLKAEFDRGETLQKLLLRYMHALYTQVSRSAACNRLHSLEERLARWLLLVQDSIESDELSLTQEFIAQMLGVRRSGVTVAAGTLQTAGMLRYNRGRIKILDREALKATACECYGVIATEFAQFLKNYPN